MPFANGHKINLTHGCSKTRLYYIYREMKARCSDDKRPNYGAKGIKVCNEWKKDFIVFREWALNNGYSESLTIDRINSDGNYEPSNCRWITQHEQILNQDRNKDRTSEMKYIKKVGVNRYRVAIYVKRKLVLSQTAISFKEAVVCRDYFLKNGVKLDLSKYTKELKSMEDI